MVETWEHVVNVPTFIPWTEDLFFSKTRFRRQLRLARISFTLERSTGVPGPLFSERALSLGAGRFNFGVGYSFIDFSELNGTNLDSVTSPALLNEVRTRTEAVQRDDGLFLAPALFSTIRTRIALNAHLTVPALRYGITDKWDVSLAIPIVNTFLKVRNDIVPLVDVDPDVARFLFRRDEQGNVVPIGYVDAQGQLISSVFQLPLVKSRRSPRLLAKAAGGATGVGDISLRTKYNFWQSEAGGAALGLSLQLPSGDERDLHGTGETHLATFLYLSQILWERFEPHLNVGVDFNVDDVDRSSFLYAVGASVLAWRQLGLLVDFIGRSEFGRFPVRVPQEGVFLGSFLNGRPEQCTKEQPCFPDRSQGDQGLRSFPFLPARIKRNDSADFSFGLRYVLGTSGSIFFGGLIPLNDDGFRADFIPSGGIEYTF